MFAFFDALSARPRPYVIAFISFDQNRMDPRVAGEAADGSGGHSPMIGRVRRLASH